MPTLYTRTFNFKDALSDAQVLEEWQFLIDQVIPALKQVPGVRAVKLYSGAGALRADLSATLSRGT